MWRLLALALLHLARTAADTSTAERIRSVAYPLDPKSSDAGAATLLFGGALLTLTAVVAGAFFLVLV